MKQTESAVELIRGTLVESRHPLHVAVVDADGRLRAFSGDAELTTYFRSAAKPFQALTLVEDGAAERFGLTDRELALCCGSHAGSRSHVRVVESILGKLGIGAELLACGTHPPFDDHTRRALAETGLEPGRLHNNCSGKHAGMIALARAHGWDPAGYERADHPVQGRILAEISRWTQVPEEVIPRGTDGCGVVTFGLPLHHMALAYASLAAAARRGDHAPARIVGAMLAHPEMVSGEGRLCTQLMRRGEGRLFAKVGAEGVYAVGVPGAELGIALKVEDGALRAVAPAILGVLRELDLISEDDLGAMHDLAYPDLTSLRREVVGQLRPRVRLRTPIRQ